MKFTTRRPTDTTLADLVARLYDAPDAETRAEAAAALTAANPEVLGKDLPAGLASLLLVPRQGPPLRDGVDSNITAFADTLAVLKRAVAGLDVVIDAETSRAQQNHDIATTIRNNEALSNIETEAAENFKLYTAEQLQGLSKRRSSLDLLRAKFDEDLTQLLTVLP